MRTQGPEEGPVVLAGAPFMLQMPGVPGFCRWLNIYSHLGGFCGAAHTAASALHRAAVRSYCLALRRRNSSVLLNYRMNSDANFSNLH